eukprot:CAMPEP_0179039970 /NCGR_PEP_ID=MMETSP0796-20121207/15408_1 /TAXON_ID=73915 /ORGANISM="Pyrodinium bahamense, Strain pbaha01" /LENGTH=313 /DNA_ID=CAMNT_0020736305 /DNA_START=54 /DNA_END=995 /DNA_ORIENTATION=-
MAATPFLEFGICGIDRSIPTEILPEVFKPVEGVRFVAAFQLAYQGFPWAPTPEYEPEAPLSGRRYEGLAYPSWDQVDEYIHALPEGTPLSFHLNETAMCPYVSGLLTASSKYHNDVLRLVDTLVAKYNARHVQVNLTAEGVPPDIFKPEGGTEQHAAMAEEAATVLVDLCKKYPQTVFLVPIAQLKRRDGTDIDTLPFFMRLINKAPPRNLSAFFDSSAGTGKEPDKAPELPDGYAKAKLQSVGFTGGIHAGNAHEWLPRYADRAKENGMTLISDAQSGFRKDGKRGAPVDVDALKELAEAVRKWGRGHLGAL